MKVFNLTFEELNELHQATKCAYFKHDKETGKVSANALWGDYCFGVDKFIKRFSEIDVSKLKIKTYVHQEIDLK